MVLDILYLNKDYFILINTLSALKEIFVKSLLLVLTSHYFFKLFFLQQHHRLVINMKENTRSTIHSYYQGAEIPKNKNKPFRFPGHATV